MNPILILNKNKNNDFNISTINFFTSSPSIQPFNILLVDLPYYINSFINSPTPNYNYIFTDNRFPISSFLIASNNIKKLYSIISHDPLSTIQGLNNNTYTLLNFAFIQKSNTTIKIIIKLLLRTKIHTDFLLQNHTLLSNFQFLSKSSQLIIIKALKKIPIHIISIPNSQLFIIQLFKKTTFEKSKSALAHLIQPHNFNTLLPLINNSICFFYNNTLKILLKKINPPLTTHFYDSPIINAIQANNLQALFLTSKLFIFSSPTFLNPLMTAIEYNFYNIYFNQDFIPSIIQLFPQDLSFQSPSGYRIYKNLPLLFTPLDSACYYNNINFILSYLHSLHFEDYSFQLLSTHYQNNPDKIFNWWSTLKFAQIIDSFLICLTKIDNNIDNQSQNSFFKNANHHINAFQDLIPIIFDFFLDYY